MSKRITRKDCLENAYYLLDRGLTQESALLARAWIELSREISKEGSLRVNE